MQRSNREVKPKKQRTEAAEAQAEAEAIAQAESEEIVQAESEALVIESQNETDIVALLKDSNHETDETVEIVGTNDKPLESVPFYSNIALQKIYDLFEYRLARQHSGHNYKDKSSSSCRHVALLVVYSKDSIYCWEILGKPDFPKPRDIISHHWHSIVVVDTPAYDFFGMGNPQAAFRMPSLTDRYDPRLMIKMTSIDNQGIHGFTIDLSTLKEIYIYIPFEHIGFPLVITITNRAFTHSRHFLCFIKEGNFICTFSAYGSENVQTGPILNIVADVSQQHLIPATVNFNRFIGHVNSAVDENYTASLQAGYQQYFTGGNPDPLHTIEPTQPVMVGEKAEEGGHKFVRVEEGRIKEVNSCSDGIAVVFFPELSEYLINERKRLFGTVFEPVEPEETKTRRQKLLQISFQKLKRAEYIRDCIRFSNQRAGIAGGSVSKKRTQKRRFRTKRKRRNRKMNPSRIHLRKSHKHKNYKN